MRCVKCGKDADFIYEGNSLCINHYRLHDESSTQWRQACTAELNQFKGSEAMIFKLFNYFADIKGIPLPAKRKYLVLKRINRAAKSGKFTEANINAAIGMAIGRGVTNLEALLKLLQVAAKRNPKEVSTNQSNVVDEINRLESQHLTN